MKKIIARYCKELRLGSCIAENYGKIRAETNEEFLVKLLKLEIENRRLARKNLYLKQANFGVMKTFSDYSFQDIQLPESVNLEDLKEGRFVERKENLILYGPVGTGKTHMATAIGVALCKNEKRVRFYRTSTLVNDLVEARDSGGLKRLLKTLEMVDLLICDEWGYIPLDRDGAHLLFQVIAQRYERNSVIITTNLVFSKWNGIFYDDKLTAAI